MRRSISLSQKMKKKVFNTSQFSLKSANLDEGEDPLKVCKTTTPPAPRPRVSDLHADWWFVDGIHWRAGPSPWCWLSLHLLDTEGSNQQRQNWEHMQSMMAGKDGTEFSVLVDDTACVEFFPHKRILQIKVYECKRLAESWLKILK